MIDRDAKCPRCGSVLPVVTVTKWVEKRIYEDTPEGCVWIGTGARLEEVEEHGDCIRCNGAS